MTIYRDVFTLEVGEADWQGDVIWTVHTANAPCEVTPLDSGDGVASGTIVTRYLVATPIDVGAVKAGPPAKQIRIKYRGKYLAFEAGIEAHRLLARFHHAEFIVKDFGA